MKQEKNEIKYIQEWNKLSRKQKNLIIILFTLMFIFFHLGFGSLIYYFLTI